MSLSSLFQIILTTGVGIIAWLVKGLIAQIRSQVEISRCNERELYRYVHQETVKRLEMHVDLLKDMISEERSNKK